MAQEFPDRSSLYEDIGRILINEIMEKLKPGDRLDSVRDLSQRFGVSAVTIKQTIIFLANEGYVERAQGKNAVVLDPRQRQHVAILFPIHLESFPASPFFAYLANGLTIVLEKKNIRSRLYRLANFGPGHLIIENTEFLDNLKCRRISGVVADGIHVPADIRKQLEDQNIPLIGTDDDSCPYSVNINSKVAVSKAVSYLAGKGCRKLGLLGWHEPGVNAVPLPNLILKAFEEEAAVGGVEVRNDWIRVNTSPYILGAGWSGFREIWLASKDKPDGLVITDEVMYADAVTAILNLRIDVPDDLRIVSFANSAHPMICPFPTTLEKFDTMETVKRMANTLICLMDGKEIENRRQYVDFEWVEDFSDVSDISEESAKLRSGS